jgi:hypothetical protein
MSIFATISHVFRSVALTLFFVLCHKIQHAYKISLVVFIAMGSSILVLVTLLACRMVKLVESS